MQWFKWQQCSAFRFICRFYYKGTINTRLGMWMEKNMKKDHLDVVQTFSCHDSENIQKLLVLS